ncbi:Pycsar system effector family protein [Kitasatospora sp. NPDC004723]|uniref:Pycsar system effector family protein n=1 Tax=Kitasatospora sp. NPDC004723 TaxID=3154288 RepID=UPI0033B308ED
MEQQHGPGPQAVTAEQYAAARKDVAAEITRTDAKAGTLLAALTLPLAVLVAAVPGHHLAPIVNVMVLLGGVGLAAAMAMTLAVVRPRMAPGLWVHWTNGDRDRAEEAPGTWVRWAHCDRDQLDADLATLDPAGRVISLSRIARDKYRLLGRAIDVTIAALLVLLLALPVGLVTA